MALALLSHAVADLALGKPALPWLPSHACVRDALAALQQLGDDASEISVWNCSHDPPSHCDCLCVGKICMQQIVCYLASETCLRDLQPALDAPLTDLLEHPPAKCTVQHIDPDASLLEAMELLIGGAHNLVLPITRRKASLYDRQTKISKSLKARNFSSVANLHVSRDHDGQEYCWLTQEDVLRFLLGSISVFSPLPSMSLDALGVIRSDIAMVLVQQDVSSALEQINEACHDESAVAVVDTIDGSAWTCHVVGDIGRSTFQTCNETASLALATLSAGDFLMFTQDCRNPPQILVDIIRTEVQEKLGIARQPQRQLSKKEDTNSLLQKLEMWEESSSEDEESGADSPSGPHDLTRRWHSAHFRSSRKGLMAKSRSGPIFCNPRSSLIAVVLQALAHREHYVWVTDEMECLMGIVTMKDILRVMLNHINIFS